MKYYIPFIVACLMLSGCVLNSNIAWRGQTDTYKYDFKAATDGHIANSPSATKGDSRIDAQKEYNDSFKSDSKVAAGDGANVHNIPSQEDQPVQPTVTAPAPTKIDAPATEEQPSSSKVLDPITK